MRLVGAEQEAENLPDALCSGTLMPFLCPASPSGRSPWRARRGIQCDRSSRPDGQQTHWIEMAATAMGWHTVWFSPGSPPALPCP